MKVLNRNFSYGRFFFSSASQYSYEESLQFSVWWEKYRHKVFLWNEKFVQAEDEYNWLCIGGCIDSPL